MLRTKIQMFNTPCSSASCEFKIKYRKILKRTNDNFIYVRHTPKYKELTHSVKSM